MRNTSTRRSTLTAITIAAAVPLIACAQAPDDGATAGLEIAVSFSEAASAEPLDGRVLVMLSTEDGDEPRFQIRGGV